MRLTFLALFVLAACSTEPEQAPVSTAKPEPTQLYPDHSAEVLEQRAIIAGSIRRLGERDRRSICEGLLTNIHTYDFCTDTVPDDWRPFEFDGETYYVIPLARNRQAD